MANSFDAVGFGASCSGTLGAGKEIIGDGAASDFGVPPLVDVAPAGAAREIDFFSIEAASRFGRPFGFAF